MTKQNSSTYVVQASPLSRMFVPSLQAKCLEDPSLLMSKDPFVMKIDRPSGAIYLTHGKPTLAATLLPVSTDREVTEDEVSPLVYWLTQEENEETDIYGVVEIPIQDNVADAIMALLEDGDDNKRMRFLVESRKKMAQGVIDARHRADARVMRACSGMYKYVKETVEFMKKEGKGVYSPSYSEALAFEVMKDIIAKRRRPEEKAQEMMRGAMSQLENPV